MEKKEFTFKFRVYNVHTDETYDVKEFTIALNEKQIREVARVMDENGGYPVEFGIIQRVENYVSEQFVEYYNYNFAPDDDDFWNNYLFETDDVIPEALLKEAEKYVTHKDVDISYYYIKDGAECSGCVTCSLQPNTFRAMVSAAGKGCYDFIQLAATNHAAKEEVMQLVKEKIAGWDVDENSVYLKELPYKVLEMAMNCCDEPDDEPAKGEDCSVGEIENVDVYEAPVIDRWNLAAENLRVASAKDWNTKPMPKDNHYVINTDIMLPPVAMERIRQGHLPQEMEDKWFMYCEGDTIRYFRSWTGYNIFNAYCVKKEDGNYHIVKVEVNTKDYTNNPRHADEAVKYLLELLSWQCAISIAEQVHVIRTAGTATDELPQEESTKSMKERFKDYLFENKKEATARVYWSMLDHTLRRIIQKEIDNEADSIFSYTTPDEVNTCMEKLMTMPTFVETNEQKHRAISAALNLYKSFIEKN